MERDCLKCKEKWNELEKPKDKKTKDSHEKYRNKKKNCGDKDGIVMNRYKDERKHMNTKEKKKEGLKLEIA